MYLSSWHIFSNHDSCHNKDLSGSFCKNIAFSRNNFRDFVAHKKPAVKIIVD